MRIISTLLGVLLFAAPAWAQDCKLVQAASLPLAPSDNGLIVTATLDGTPAPLNFTLAAGNGINTLYRSYVDAHKFENQRAKTGSVTILLARNYSEMNMATVHNFVLGPVKGSNLDFLILPEDQPSPDVVGSIMQTALADFDFELNVQDKKLNLFLQSHCPGQVVYWTASAIARLPFLSTDMDGRFEMQLDGKPVRVLLSPGDATSLIGSKALHRIFGIDLNSPGVERIAGTPDSDPRYTYHFSTLTIDALTIRNPGITIYVQKDDECLDKPNIGIGSRVTSEQVPGCFGGHDVALGVSVLRQLRMFFANKERMLYVTPAAAH